MIRTSERPKTLPMRSVSNVSVLCYISCSYAPYEA